jgi:predicted PurR-regulated permease PerM
MNFVEIIRGIGNVAFVMALAGTVAYVGDRVGHQVGRRRLTLFGIRPRYTSTIVAIATGMVIGLVVTLVAIFASEQVKTAFFKLNSINQQISELQARQRDLETKVNTGRLVLPVDTLMVPFYRIISQSATSAQRLSTIRE